MPSLHPEAQLCLKLACYVSHQSSWKLYALASARRENFTAQFGTLWRNGPDDELDEQKKRETERQAASLRHTSGCFAAETLVMLSDGSYLRVDLIDVGTELFGGKVIFKKVAAFQFPFSILAINTCGLSRTIRIMTIRIMSPKHVNHK